MFVELCMAFHVFFYNITCNVKYVCQVKLHDTKNKNLTDGVIRLQQMHCWNILCLLKAFCFEVRD